MKANLLASLAGLCLTFLVLPPLVHGTDSYAYKPGETLVIDHGLAPDGSYAIAAGAVNKKDDGHYGLFLIDGKSRRRIGPLEEFGGSLDSGAKSFRAAWAPDSRHVAITYRVDRSVTEMLVYRIENRRAYAVTGPRDVLAEVKGSGAVDTHHGTTFYLEPSWLTASRFRLRQHSQYHRAASDPTPILGRYVEVSAEEGDEDKGANGKRVYSFDFYADAMCELRAGDKYHLLSMKPVADKDRWPGATPLRRQ